MLTPSSNIRESLYLLLLLMCISTAHRQAAAQGIITNARLISSEGTLIRINGNLEMHQSAQLEGLLKLTGNLSDHYGLEVNAGRVSFAGTGHDQLLSGEAISVFNEMEIGPQARLLITAGKRLTINGDLLNNNASGGLRLLANDNGTASLIHSSEGVSAQVQKHFNTASGQYHMLAAPVAFQSFEPEFYVPEAYLYAWHEPYGAYVDYTNDLYYPTFIYANHGADHFLPATGYLISYPPGDTGELIKEFEGPMHQGEVSFMISYLNQHAPFSSYNLAGNPYPSTIDWNAKEGWSGKEHLSGGKSKHEKPAWVWNDEIQNFGVVHPRSHHGMHNDVSGHIPAMTAFWVQAAPGSHGELLTMDDRVRVHSPPTEEKEKMPDAASGIIRLAISLENQPWRDEVLIEYHQDEALPGTGKMFSMNPDAPQLYVVHEGQNLSLLFLNEPTAKQEIMLGYEAPENSTFFLNAHLSDDVPVKLILEDLLKNRQHILNSRGDAISFSSSDSSPPINTRFVLHIHPLSKQ